MTENDFLNQLLDLAKVLGWRRAHFRPARTAYGWRTAVSGDGVGFPDLILVRGRRILAVELKSQRGALTEEQGDWLTSLQVAGVETHVWRPADFDAAVICLR